MHSKVYKNLKEFIEKEDLDLLSQSIIFSITSQVTITDINNIEDYVNNNKFYTYSININNLLNYFTGPRKEFYIELRQALRKLHKIIITNPKIGTKKNIVTNPISYSYIMDNKIIVNISPLLILMVQEEENER